MIIVLSFIAYYKILKESKYFDSIKRILIAALLVGIAFSIAMPNTSQDVFYYMGVGRTVDTYNMNPYMVTPENVLNTGIEDNILSGAGVWSNEKVVYGPLWISICAILNKLSFGSLLCYLFIFKMVNLFIYLISVFLVYKLTGKKKMAALFAFNPLVLLEVITNVHNDIYLVMFCLLAIWFIKMSDKESNKIKKLFLIIISMIFLLFASLIKYVALIFVPFAILYVVRNKKWYEKLLYLIINGLVFGSIFILMYLPWFNNLSGILNGIFAQQGKLMNSIYVIIYQVSKGNKALLDLIYSVMFFILFYFVIINILVRFRDKTKLRIDMQDLGFLVAFLMFGVLTTITAWYMLWLFIFVYWFRSQNVKNVLYLSLGFELSNILFILVHDMNPLNECVVIPTLILCLILGRFLNDKKKRRN